MSLFSKGPWTRMAVNPEDLPLWQEFLDNPRKVFAASALAARTELMAAGLDAIAGINPPKWPCGDAPTPLNQRDLDKRLHPQIAANLRDEDNLEPWEVGETLLEDLGLFDLYQERYFGKQPVDFCLLDTNTPVYGFWLVHLKRAILDDVKALREHAAATSNARPFGTLSGTQKKDITKGVESDGLIDYIERGQCPVIIDFTSGDLWVGSTKKAHIEALKIFLLRRCAITCFNTKMTPGGAANWATAALNVFVEKDRDKEERREAYEKRKESEARSGSPEEDMELPEGEAPKEDEDDYSLTNLAVYAPDAGGTATVSAKGSVAFTRVGKSSVAVADPMDALEILYHHEGATVLSAEVEFLQFVGGAVVSGTVAFDDNLSTGVYRGLDLSYSVQACELLEAEDVVLNGTALMDEDRDRDPNGAHVVARYWYRFYLMLNDFCSTLLGISCDALELDPSLVRIEIPAFHRNGEQGIMATEPEVTSVEV